MRVGELFAGIGGFGLGLERAGMRVVWHSEIEPFACAVLRKHWPLVPNYGDIRAIRAADVATVDVLCGGFPCQDISIAGKGVGIEGQQSGLWREFARLVRELRPRWVIAENVTALRTRGYDRIAADLEAAGYTVWAFVVGADDIGASHRRKRVWIIAYAGRLATGIQGGGFGGRRRRANLKTGIAADADCARLAERQSERSDASQEFATFIRGNRWQWDCAPEPTIRRMDDGLSAGLLENRGPRLAALGNSLVPQIAEAIGRAIMRVEMECIV